MRYQWHARWDRVSIKLFRQCFRNLIGVEVLWTGVWLVFTVGVPLIGLAIALRLRDAIVPKFIPGMEELS